MKIAIKLLLDAVKAFDFTKKQLKVYANLPIKLFPRYSSQLYWGFKSDVWGRD